MKNKRKTLLVALIVAIILLSSMSVVFADDVLASTVSIEQSATHLNQGDMVNFNIRVNIPEGENSISATTGYINFDSNFFSDYEVSDGMTKGENGSFTSTKILNESGIVGTIKLKIAQKSDFCHGFGKVLPTPSYRTCFSISLIVIPQSAQVRLIRYLPYCSSPYG
jgi:hypothetical protein